MEVLEEQSVKQNDSVTKSDLVRQNALWKRGIVTGEAGSEEQWKTFIRYKEEAGHLNEVEKKELLDFVERRAFEELQQRMANGCFPGEYPVRKIVNKEGTGKKRVVYSFSRDVTIMLKFIAFQLYRYEEIWEDNCYSFRRNYGVRDALRSISRNRRKIDGQYCLKLDIQDYFNSIDPVLLMEQLGFVRESDPQLYRIFRNILLEPKVYVGKVPVEDRHGAMAGIPIAPFFANLYLTEMDKQFDYYRYSDDILLFEDSMEALLERKAQMEQVLEQLGLLVNREKEKISCPGEEWEFLGFAYQNGIFDLSANTKRKAKAKIKRKAEALRRWQRKKGLTPDKAAIGFIRAMNRKFYGTGDEQEFTWSRWFFGNLTTDRGLKEIDAYMQQYIRYAVTGRHYKGNYRIPYDRLKAWGYRSLVHEYYDNRVNFVTRKNMRKKTTDPP